MCRLELLPRTIPDAVGAASPIAGSAIFGGAKPVDTTMREREIEEKKRKEEEARVANQKAEAEAAAAAAAATAVVQPKQILTRMVSTNSTSSSNADHTTQHAQSGHVNNDKSDSQRPGTVVQDYWI